MRLRNFFIAVAVLALAVPGLANAEGGFKVTGGGQALAEVDDSGEAADVRGPGDTYGFNAISTGEPEAGVYPAKGQFNSIQRNSEATVGRGKGEHIRGTVTCLVAAAAPSDSSEGTARFGGYIRGGTPANGPFFTVEVTDNGEGNGADDDVIVFQQWQRTGPGTEDEDREPCERADRQNDDVILARGNVQIHNYPAN